MFQKLQSGLGHFLFISSLEKLLRVKMHFYTTATLFPSYSRKTNINNFFNEQKIDSLFRFNLLPIVSIQPATPTSRYNRYIMQMDIFHNTVIFSICEYKLSFQTALFTQESRLILMSQSNLSIFLMYLSYFLTLKYVLG